MSSRLSSNHLISSSLSELISSHAISYLILSYFYTISSSGCLSRQISSHLISSRPIYLIILISSHLILSYFLSKLISSGCWWPGRMTGWQRTRTAARCPVKPSSCPATTATPVIWTQTSQCSARAAPPGGTTSGDSGKHSTRSGGYLSSVRQFLRKQEFWCRKSICYILWISLIFDRCHRSWAAAKDMLAIEYRVHIKQVSPRRWHLFNMNAIFNN